jgi:hypothetical protein
MRSSIPLLVAALITALPAGLVAQGLPTIGVGRGLTFDLSDGEPISFFLEHSRELELTDAQKMSLIDVRRRLRRTNEIFMEQLDSLRDVVGLSREPRPRLTDADRDALERFRRLSEPVTQVIRANNQTAQAEARTLLTVPQRATFDSLATHVGDASRGRGRGRPPRP